MQRGSFLNPIADGMFRAALRNEELRRSYVGWKLFPVFATALASAQYYVFDVDSWLNMPTDIRRAPGAPHKEHVTKLSDDNYRCQSYGIKGVVPDEIRQHYAKTMGADQAVMEQNALIHIYNAELRIKAKATNPATIANSSPATKWNQANSKPRADVIAGKALLNANSAGFEANTILISRDVADVLIDHADVKENVKYVQGGNITVDQLRQYFQIENLIIAGGFTNSAADGQAVTAARIWGDTVILAYVDPRASTDFAAPTFGRSFRWTGVGLTESWRDSDRKSDMHSADEYLDEKLTGNEFGYLLTDVLA